MLSKRSRARAERLQCCCLQLRLILSRGEEGGSKQAATLRHVQLARFHGTLTQTVQIGELVPDCANDTLTQSRSHVSPSGSANILQADALTDALHHSLVYSL